MNVDDESSKTDDEAWPERTDGLDTVVEICPSFELEIESLVWIVEIEEELPRVYPVDPADAVDCMSDDMAEDTELERDTFVI